MVPKVSREAKRSNEMLDAESAEAILEFLSTSHYAALDDPADVPEGVRVGVAATGER